MPTSFDVTSAAGRYRVRMEEGALDALLRFGGDRVFVADAIFRDRLRTAGVDAILIEADEPAKSLDRMADLITALRERGATRRTELVAVGGGVVQDVAAFAASIYMRGIAWTYVPTTLLSMTDSCIGGKSSINVGRYKNIVGTFHPPREVVIDPTLCGTLSAEQRAAGLCEAAKICLCRGQEEFEAYATLGAGADADASVLMAVVDRSLRAKAWFIEIDEFDRAERLLLNFGHTFGHALEAASRFGVTHGIAVGLGMLAALHLGEAQGRDYSGATHVARFRRHVRDLVRAAPDLGPVLERVSTAEAMDAFRSDKKHTRDAFAVIMVDEDGRVERRMLPRDARTEAVIERAFARMLDEFATAAA